MTMLGTPPTIRAPRSLRARVVDGAALLRLLTVTGVATVLVTRGFLALAGYPQVGGHGLHIAHVLWGGLLMLAGLICALLFVGARRWTAVLGGIGLGLFIDEVGKFLTSTNDYFFPLAAVIIYLVFAALLVVAALFARETTADQAAGVPAAAQKAVDGLARGLTAAERAAATRLLGAATDPTAAAVRDLLAAVPPRNRPTRAEAGTARMLAAARGLADRRHVPAALLGLFVAGRAVVMVVFAVQLVLLVTHGHPDARPAVIVGITVGNAVALGLALAGAVEWRRHRPVAYRWFHAAVLVDLLLVDVFEFVDSQFRATASLPYDLLVLALVGYGRRTFPAPPPPRPRLPAGLRRAGR